MVVLKHTFILLLGKRMKIFSVQLLISEEEMCHELVDSMEVGCIVLCLIFMLFC